MSGQTKLALRATTMQQSRLRQFVGFIAAALFVTYISHSIVHNGHESVLVQQAAVRPNSLIQIAVPLSQLAETKVGDIVKGTVPEGDNGGGNVEFTGQVTKGTKVSSASGALTVRVLSDKYVAPGTQVSGRVGNTLFSGTVFNSPNTEERLGNIEKRLSAVEKPTRDQVVGLHKTVSNIKSRLERIEGTSTMKDKIKELEKRIFHLKHRAAGLSVDLFKNNEEGFHFHGAIGPNTLMPAVDKMEKSVSAIEDLPAPDQIMRPVMKRLDVLESRIDDLKAASDPAEAVSNLENRLVKLEKRAKKFHGELAAAEEE